MPEIIKAGSRKELKAFFSFSETCGYTAGECEYIQKYARAPGGIYLMCMHKGQPLARLLTWQTRGEGFFALPDGDKAALSMLASEAVRLHTEAGSRCLRGPLMPDGSFVFTGLAGSGDEGRRGLFTSLPGRERLEAFLDAGFEAECVFEAFTARIPSVNKYASAAEWAAKRFQAKVSQIREGAFFHDTARVAFDLERAHKRAYARTAEKLAPYIDTRFSYCVRDVNGAVRGCALTFKGDIPRVAVFVTYPPGKSRFATLMLVSALMDSFIGCGITEVQLSVINSENRASLLLARAANAYKRQEFVQCNKNLI